MLHSLVMHHALACVQLLCTACSCSTSRPTPGESMCMTRWAGLHPSLEGALAIAIEAESEVAHVGQCASMPFSIRDTFHGF